MRWNNYYPPYVPVAERCAKATKEAAKMAKKGVPLSPVAISGRAIASTFWGKAWCKHLESYSDFSNRLPRGRTYVRNGSVIDLKIKPAKITAQVMGSSLYKQTITITPIANTRWKTIKNACAGRIDSLVELLQGRFSDGVMSVITHREEGMFPQPKEIKMDCSCPDWAGLCKHLAAVLYGVGARLDTQPELLFTLRQADHSELITEAASAQVISAIGTSADLDVASLSDVFGIDIDLGVPTVEPPSPLVKKPARKLKAAASKPKAKPVKKPAKTSKTTMSRAAALTPKPRKPVMATKEKPPAIKSHKAAPKGKLGAKPAAKAASGKRRKPANAVGAVRRTKV